MDLKILNNSGEIVKIINAFNVTQEQSLPFLNVLDFETTEEVNEGQRIIIKTEKKPNETIYDEFIITRIDKQNNYSGVHCEGVLYELYGIFIGDVRPRNATAEEALKTVLKDSRFEAEALGLSDVASMVFYHQNGMEALSKICEVYRVEAEAITSTDRTGAIHRIIKLSKQRGRDNGKRFEAGFNLGEISKTIDSTDLITALYPFGKGEKVGNGYGRRIDIADVNNGVLYVENTDARQKYGIKTEDGIKHIYGTHIFENIEDKAELKENAERMLAEFSHPKITYNFEVFYTDGEAIGVELGDIVSVIDDNIGRVKTRVTRIKKRLDIEGSYELEVETRESRETIAQNSTRQVLKELKEAVEELKYNDFNINEVEGLIDKFNADLNAGLNGGKIEYYPGGIRFISSDGKSAMEISTRGFRIASDKLPSGDWNWQVLGTGDGLAANSIGAKQIQAGAIKADHLSAGVVRASLGEIGGFTIEDNRLITDNSDRKLAISGKSGEKYFLEAVNKYNDKKFLVDWAGGMTATEANIEGNLVATSGKIGAWDIADNMIKSDNAERTLFVNSSGSGYFLYAKKKSEKEQSFSVDWDGSLFARNATVHGNIRAISGNIGNWSIVGDQIKSETAQRTLFLNCAGSGWFIYAKKAQDTSPAFAVDWDGTMHCRKAIIDGESISGKAKNLGGSVHNMGGSVSGLSGSVSSLGGTLASMGGSVSNLGGTFGSISGTSWSGGVYSRSGELAGVSFFVYSGTYGSTLRFSGNISAYSLSSGSFNLNKGRIDILDAGTITYGGLHKASDENLKEDITEASENYKNIIYNTKLKNFVYKSDKTRKNQIGVIAQELIKNIPDKKTQAEFISVNEKGNFSVDYERLFISSIQAIQDLNNRVKDLENKILEMEKNKND